MEEGLKLAGGGGGYLDLLIYYYFAALLLIEGEINGSWFAVCVQLCLCLL